MRILGDYSFRARRAVIKTSCLGLLTSVLGSFSLRHGPGRCPELGRELAVKERIQSIPGNTLLTASEYDLLQSMVEAWCA